jgi:hypothetical protein
MKNGSEDIMVKEWKSVKVLLKRKSYLHYDFFILFFCFQKKNVNLYHFLLFSLLLGYVIARWA